MDFPKDDQSKSCVNSNFPTMGFRYSNLSFFADILTNNYSGCELGNFWIFSAENFRKFMLIFSEISENWLITYVNQLFPSLTLESDLVK